MSVYTIQQPAGPPIAPPTSNTWFLMEAMLGTAQVHDLLAKASARLDRLQRDVPLSPEAITDVGDALRSIAVAASKLDAMRRTALE